MCCSDGGPNILVSCCVISSCECEGLNQPFVVLLEYRILCCFICYLISSWLFGFLYDSLSNFLVDNLV